MMWFLAVLLSSLIFWTWNGQRPEEPEAPPACVITQQVEPPAPEVYSAELPVELGN